MNFCKLIKSIILGGSILALSIAYVGCSNESSESTLDKDTLITLKEGLMSLDKTDYDIINNHYFIK